MSQALWRLPIYAARKQPKYHADLVCHGSVLRLSSDCLERRGRAIRMRKANARRACEAQ